MKALKLVLAFAFMGAMASGCVVRERRVAHVTPMGCRGGVYVEGHRDWRGGWHPGHWRCPGRSERIIIE